MANARTVSIRTEAALVGALAGLVYVLGACTTVYVGDSGELTAAVGTLGIPHPSGYPLYVLLGKLWTLLVPVGSIAYRMSLFSAAAGALTAAVVYAIARRCGLARSASALGALLLAFAPSFWSQANVQRVYTLNAAFVAAVTYLALSWHGSRNPRTIAATFFVAGLGACNHTFVGLQACVVALWMAACEPSAWAGVRAALRRALSMALPFAAGLLPYAYLPLRSRMNPRLDWGNPESLQNFLGVVFRRDFWERAWLETPADLIPIAADYFGSFAGEFTLPGALLVVAGTAVAARRRPAFACLALAVMAANAGAMAVHGSRSDLFLWHRYYIPSYAMAALLSAFAWDAVARRLGSPRQWIALVLPALLLVSGFAQHDRSRYRIAEDFASAVLESLPPGAGLIATDDNVLFVLMYLHLVEGRRPDIHLIMQGVGNAELPPLRFNPETEPLYFTHHPNWNVPNLEIVPLGVVYRAWNADVRAPPPVLPRETLAGETDPRVPKDYLTSNLIGHFHYTMGFTFENLDWPRARRSFEAAAAAASGNDVLFYNLGLVYARNGLYEDALAAFQRSDRINPRHLASLSKPQASLRAAEVRRELDRIAAVERGLLDRMADAPERGTADYHFELAAALDAADERIAAKGHRIRAAEIVYN